RMGVLEPELETGVTYLTDNHPTTIATTLTRVVESGQYVCTASRATHQRYGSTAVVGMREGVLNLVVGVQPPQKYVVLRLVVLRLSSLLRQLEDWMRPSAMLARSACPPRLCAGR